jgi:competence protein ComEA
MLLAGGLPAAQAAPEAEGAGDGAAAVDTTVSLNNAGVEELQTLKGIGPKTAASIVAWRDREGPFESVDQLMAVKGIGEMTLSRIRDRLSL